MTRSLRCLGSLTILAVASAALAQPADTPFRKTKSSAGQPAQAPVAEPTAPVPAADHRTITVTGSATVHYYADAARIQFRLRSSEATLDESREAARKAVKQADEKLSALKIKDMKIAFAPVSTSQASSRGGFNGFRAKGGGPGGPGGAAAPETITFTCNQIVTLIVRETDLDKMAEQISKIEKTLIDAGLVNGNAVVEDDFPGPGRSSGLTVALLRRDDTEFREEALTKAVQNALHKAKAIARGAGVQIKETVSIVEIEPTAAEIARQARSASATAVPGELEVTVRVSVKCSY